MLETDIARLLQELLKDDNALWKVQKTRAQGETRVRLATPAQRISCPIKNFS
jgi:hypothetical protein